MFYDFKEDFIVKLTNKPKEISEKLIVKFGNKVSIFPFQMKILMFYVVLCAKSRLVCVIFHIIFSLVVVVVVVVCVLGETFHLKGNEIRLNLMFLCCYFCCCWFWKNMFWIFMLFNLIFILRPLESLNKMENQLNPFSYKVLYESNTN